MTDPNTKEMPETQDEGDDIDPLEPLIALAEELNHPQTGHRVRVESIAKSLKQELASLITGVNAATPEGAAIHKIAEICVTVLEEQAGTSMAILADLATMTADVFDDVRGDISDLEEEAGVGGGGEVVFGLHPEDAAPIRALLLEYRELVVDIGKNNPANAELVKVKLGDIDRVLTRVSEIELHPLGDQGAEDEGAEEDDGDATD